MWLLALGTMGSGIVKGVQRYYVPESQDAMLTYFRTTFPALHQQTKTVQAGLAGLLDETAPTAEVAVARLEQNIMPALDYVLVQARAVHPSEVSVRALHMGYVESLERMAQGARSMREIFADAAATLPDKRRRATTVVAGVRADFDEFYARSQESWREAGIQIDVPDAGGTP